MFSASYDTRALHGSNAAKDFVSWGSGFATRVFPALPVDAKLARDAADDGTEYSWDNYAADVFSAPLARQFYGLDSNELRTSSVTGIGRIGAHPLVSVISGSLLCLSDGAILDLPPFSNFGLNVSWIDDHLKYCLHRELRHLSTVELKIEPLLSDAKLDSVMVQKARAAVSNLPTYVLSSYLPTLLWGTIVDAWITPDPLLKYRPEQLSEETQSVWRDIPRDGQSNALLPAALQRALEKRVISPIEKRQLEAQLTDVAMLRINDVRSEFARLTASGQETFASIWAKGEVRNYFPNLPHRCQGLAEQDIPLASTISNPRDLNRYLQDDFRTLVHDAVEYIDWTLNWPKICQVVRSVEQGTIRTDMSWRPTMSATP